MTTSFVRILNVLGLAAVLIFNWLANALPLNGLTTGEISAMFPVKITPAPYAFTIWGLIYALLIGFVVVQFLPSRSYCPELQNIGLWFVASCLFNCSWIMLWHYLFTLASVFVMIALLLTLIAIYVISRPDGWSNDPLIRWLVQAPFSVYLGWITVAAIVNMTVGLYKAGWSDAGDAGTLWTVGLIVLAAAVALLTGFRFNDPLYALTVVWALVAIGAANRDIPLIAYTAWSASALLFAFSVWLLSGETWLGPKKRAFA